MSTPAHRPATLMVIWGVPCAALLHNVEEVLMFPRYAPSVLALAPDALRARMPAPELVYPALVVATVIPLLLALIASRQPTGSWATYGLLLVAAVMLVNVAWHVAAATLLGGYAPGVATGLAINLPVMTTVLRRARRDGWLSRGSLWTYLAIGVMLHGAGLLALFAFATFSR